MMGMCAVHIWKLFTVLVVTFVGFMVLRLDRSSPPAGSPALPSSPAPCPPRPLVLPSSGPPALLGPLSSPPLRPPALKPPSELYHEHGAMYQLHPWLFSRPSRVPGYASRLPSPSCFPPGNPLILAPASVFTTLWLQHLGRRVLRDHLDGAPVGERRAEAPGPS